MKRNRAQTEQRIIDASIDLICVSGFSHFGINHVASHSGADKVLIYRYFEGIEGLMQRIANEVEFFPPAATLFSEDTPQDMVAFIRNYRDALEERPFTQTLIAWQDAVRNPLTDALRTASDHFWQEATAFAQPQNAADRAFISCLRPILNDSVANGDVLAALEQFSYAPAVPEAAREATKTTASKTPSRSSNSEELPTNLL